jgi:hypothetical protein
MKFNKWTLALASVGIVSMGSVAQADEHSVNSTAPGTTLSGYVDTSAIWKIGSGRGALPGRSFDGADKVDGFNLNVVKVSLEKALGDANAWSAGYKADLLFGPDANAYNTVMNGGGLSPNTDDVSIKQAYVALRAPVGNGLDIKMGVWDTLIGYEFFDSSANPNYSRSYGFFLEPLHHTGVMASYKISDLFAISGGVANSTGGGAINAKDPVESKKSYLAALTVTLPEGAGSFKNSTISVGFIDGTVPGVSAGQSTRNYYAGATLNTPVEGLTVGASWDYLENPAGLLPGVSGDAYAVAAYIGFGQDKWKLNLRADYTQATAGFYYAGGNGNTGVAKTDRDELGSLTLSLDYNLWENVLTRLEGRYDRALSGDTPFGTNDEGAVTVALSAVYKF